MKDYLINKLLNRFYWYDARNNLSYIIYQLRRFQHASPNKKKIIQSEMMSLLISYQVRHQWMLTRFPLLADKITASQQLSATLMQLLITKDPDWFTKLIDTHPNIDHSQHPPSRLQRGLFHCSYVITQLVVLAPLEGILIVLYIQKQWPDWLFITLCALSIITTSRLRKYLFNKMDRVLHVSY